MYSSSSLSSVVDAWSAPEPELEGYLGPMTEYPRFVHSMKAVRRVGDRLADPIHFSPDMPSHERDAAIEAFAIAHNWRDDHFLPMRSIRFSVRHHMKKAGAKGDLASRIKRMTSIRRKLRESTVKLDQMNDLGGVRAIMDDISGVNALISAIGEKFQHTIRQQYPYIEKPKDDGYRSHHVVLSFVGEGEREVYSGRRVELQIRTRLQHAWATAVEAAGLYRGEDFKHHRGDADWLRFFQLVSSEFAHTEGCPEVPGTQSHHERVEEIKDLNQKLKATETLEHIKNATEFAESFVYDAGRFFLIRYRKDHTVSVETHDRPIAAAYALTEHEMRIEQGIDDEKVVLVEVDKVTKLVETYPNYFGDVSLFVMSVKRICDGRGAIEYSLAPQEIVGQKPRGVERFYDLRRLYTRWTERR